MNLVSGLRNMAEDWERAVSGKKPVGTENFVVGTRRGGDARQGRLSAIG